MIKCFDLTLAPADTASDSVSESSPDPDQQNSFFHIFLYSKKPDLAYTAGYPVHDCKENKPDQKIDWPHISFRVRNQFSKIAENQANSSNTSHYRNFKWYMENFFISCMQIFLHRNQPRQKCDQQYKCQDCINRRVSHHRSNRIYPHNICIQLCFRHHEIIGSVFWRNIFNLTLIFIFKYFFRQI